MNEQLQVIYLPIDELLPDVENAKEHPAEQIEQIKKSITRFKMCDPIGVTGEDNLILEGHGRYLALKALGVKEVPCIRLDHLKTKEERDAYSLIHNKLTMNSGFNVELLELKLDNIVDINMEEFGFELPEEETETKEDDFEVNPPAKPKTKRGDIYQLGEHRLMCGDSTVLTEVECLMGGYKADLLLTDPPYNVAYEGKTKDKLKIDNDSMGDDEFRQFLRDAFTCADMVMKPGAVFYIWHTDNEAYNFHGATKDVKWKTHECLIWAKNSMVMGHLDYHKQHEPCLYGWKDGAGHLWASDGKQTTIINWDRPSRNAEHPTMKPIGLFDYQIKNNTKGGDIVLDLFGGSGTTLMACEQNKRIAYLMELDPKYCDVIVERWEKFTGKKAVLVNA